jgi:membrane protein implicated in regulation of membrane protease activity
MDVQRFLILLGAILLVAGFLWPWASHLGLGRLPGDIAIERPNFRLYFPWVTCLVVSVVLTLLIWLFRK